MQLIGITGSSGSGKSTVADYYAAQGYTVIDGDAVSRQLAVPGSAYIYALQREFGADLCDEQGRLLRRAMAERAFATPEGQQRLTRVTAPLILEEVKRRVSQCEARGEQLAFLDGALILDTPFADLCRCVIAVLADRSAQVLRICERDGVARQAAEDRLSRQWSNEQMRQKADICIYNLTDKEELLCTAKRILEQLKNGAGG